MRAAFVLLARGFGLAGNQRFGLAQENVGNQPVHPVLLQVVAAELRQFRLREFAGLGQSGSGLVGLLQLVLGHSQNRVGRHVALPHRQGRSHGHGLANYLPHRVNDTRILSPPISGQPLVHLKIREPRIVIAEGHRSVDQLAGAFQAGDRAGNEQAGFGRLVHRYPHHHWSR